MLRGFWGPTPGEKANYRSLSSRRRDPPFLSFFWLKLAFSLITAEACIIFLTRTVLAVALFYSKYPSA